MTINQTIIVIPVFWLHQNETQLFFAFQAYKMCLVLITMHQHATVVDHHKDNNNAFVTVKI